MAARFAAGTDALASAVRERQDLATQWQVLDKGIVRAASKPPTQRDPKAEAILRAQFIETETKLDALDARIAREFPQYAELSNPKPIEIAATQSLLAPDEAMLVYLVGESESWLWALRRDRAALYKIDITAKALTAEVAVLRKRLDLDLNPDLAHLMQNVPMRSTRRYWPRQHRCWAAHTKSSLYPMVPSKACRSRCWSRNRWTTTRKPMPTIVASPGSRAIMRSACCPRSARFGPCASSPSAAMRPRRLSASATPCWAVHQGHRAASAPPACSEVLWPM
jgi:hypothetical protein